MEAKTAQLFNRLDKQKKDQLFMMMQSAIDEMYNTNIFAQISPEVQQLMHDPDPEIRVANKTKLAMSVGNSCSKFSINRSSGVLEWEETINFEPAWANAICMSMLNRFETLLGPDGDFSGVTVHLHILIEDERGRDCANFKKLVEELADMYGITAVSFHETHGSAAQKFL